MVTWSGHGGGCCGIIHLWDFGTTPDGYLKSAGKSGNLPKEGESIEDWIKRVIWQALQSQYGGSEEWEDEDNWNALVEVVLNGEQILWGWGKVLYAIGFSEVSKFLNSNSDNMCYVFHLQTKDI